MSVSMAALAASCGPVTPIATATTTQLPASTGALSITPTPSLLLLSPSNGPDKDISFYRLRAWTEDNYNQTVHGLNDRVGADEGQITSLMVPAYSVSFQLEHLLKFPNSSARGDILWDILINKPETITIPGIQPADDLMSSLIADLLAKNILPTHLSDEIERHGLQVINTTPVQNIIGNGEDGLVFLIRIHGPETLMGVFVILSDDEKFHVQKIRDWEVSEAVALYRDYKIYDVGDTNGNGLPEIVVQIQAGGGGISKESIDHIEWSPQDKKFQRQSFPVFWQTCDDAGVGPCEGNWEFSTIDSQYILTTKSYWSTRNDCPGLAIQRVSVWDGTQYALENPEFVSPNDNLTAECRLAWAETAIWMPVSFWDSDIKKPGWKNDLAISIVEKSLNNWPAQADEIWGPASRDYFKLKLGIWYELRNEDKKAKILLQQLANRPHQTEYDFPSRLASLYLQKRAVSGRARACLELKNAYYEELRIKIPELSPYNNDDAMLKAWGIVDTKEPLCDIYDMLLADMRNANWTSPEALMGWLNTHELTIYRKEDIDLNNDGLLDHLIWLDVTDSGVPDTWTFLATSNGYQAGYVSDIWPKDEQSKLNIQSIKIGNSMLAYLLSSNGELIIFRVRSDLGIETLVEDYGVQSFDVNDEVTPTKLLVHTDNSYDGQGAIVYIWDSNMETFVEQTDSFVVAQAEIEKLLYTEKDYQEVINYLDKFLQIAPPEPKRIYFCSADIPEGCKYLPDWYMPYFRYLRGLAYEQLGQNEQAKRSYFELWRDFPKNVFGMVASLKLEPVNP